jgi:cytochrome b6-f complex iron-sulfur subunit
VAEAEEKTKSETEAASPKSPQLVRARCAARSTRRASCRRWLRLGGVRRRELGLLGAMGRFMFPNVLYEPPQEFKAGFPDDFGVDQVDERFKAAYGVWIVREPDGLLRALDHLHAPRLHAQLAGGGGEVQVPLPRLRAS